MSGAIVFIWCWNSQGTWHYIRLLEWIASSPADCFECKIISGIRKRFLSLACLKLLASAYAGLRRGMGWHFSWCWNLLPQAWLCVFLPCQEEGLPALGHHLLYSLGKGKSKGYSELPIRIPESEGRAWAPPWQTDPPSEICMKWAESLRSPLHD